jgi:hypothetical protein
VKVYNNTGKEFKEVYLTDSTQLSAVKSTAEKKTKTPEVMFHILVFGSE